ASPRTHIRTLLLEFLAQQKEPDSLEITIIRPLLSGTDGALVLRAATGSPGWFACLRDSSELAAWMSKAPEHAAYCMNLLAAALRFDPDGVYWLLERYWAPRPECDNLAHAVVQHVPEWNEAWVRMLCNIATRSKSPVAWTALKVAETKPAYAPRIL